MSALTTIGWREWLALPDLGIAAIKAKIDSGARSSALHVDALQEFELHGQPWVKFLVRTGLPGKVLRAECQAPAIDCRPVTDSGGHTTERWFIRTRIALGGAHWHAEINLTNRRNMLFPMLLGRTAMAAHLRIDPSASFLCGLPPSGSVATQS